MSAVGGMTLDNFDVQVIVGDGGDPRSGKVVIGLPHIFSACLPAYALGVPSSQVQLYCSNNIGVYRFKIDVVERRKLELRARLDYQLRVQTNKNGEFQTEQDVFPSFFGGLLDGASDGEPDDNFFGYVFSIIQGFEVLKDSLPLPNCAMRIICGHSTGSINAPTGLSCGKDNSNFYDLVRQNASVLTVIDCCLPLNAILGLLGRKSKNEYKKKEKKVQNGLNFPVACPGTVLTRGFFVSFVGHHLTPRGDEDYLAPQMAERGMTMSIGFPVMSSIMVAVKARYIDTPPDRRHLHEIAQGQLDSVQHRYLSQAPSSSALFHNQLNLLQELLDSQVLKPKRDGFNCCLYERKLEWFSDLRMDTPLIPTGWNGHQMNAIIMNYVIEKVKQWHEERKGKKTCFRNSELAWDELSRLMGRFHDAFDHITIERKSFKLLWNMKIRYPFRTLVRVSRDPNTYKKRPFEDWAVTCERLPEIVNNVVIGIADGIDELRVEMLADESMLESWMCEEYPFVYEGQSLH